MLYKISFVLIWWLARSGPIFHVNRHRWTMLLATRLVFFGFPRLPWLPLTQRLRNRVEQMGYQKRGDFEQPVALRHQLEPGAGREGSSQHQIRSLCRLRHHRCSDQGKHGSAQYWTFGHYARAGRRGARRFDSWTSLENKSPVALRIRTEPVQR